MSDMLNYMYKYYNSLMTTPCELVSVVVTANSDGTRSNTYVNKWSGNCNFHSISIQESKFTDKVGTKSVYMVCIPFNVEVSLLDKIRINNTIYSIVGVRDATRKYENIIEVVKYE